MYILVLILCSTECMGVSITASVQACAYTVECRMYGIKSYKENGFFLLCIRESVDSLCRDDADMPMPPYIGKACNRPNAAFVSLFR